MERRSGKFSVSVMEALWPLTQAAASGSAQARNLCRRSVGDRKDAAHIDLAQDVAVFTSLRARTVKKVRIPNDRQRLWLQVQSLHHLRHPLRFHRRPEGLKIRCRCTLHDAGTGLWRRPLGGRRHQRLDELMSKAHDLVGTHVTTDHAVRKAGLKRLIDDAAVTFKVSFATLHEIGEEHVLRHTASCRLQHAYAVDGGRVKLDLPDALSRISAILLEHARSG